MTGFGEARHQADGLILSVEVRTVNNRYLKVSVRGSEPYPMLEPDLEKVVRKFVRRGTVTIHVRCERRYRSSDCNINMVALSSYLEQIRRACEVAGQSSLLSSLVSQALTL